MTNLDDYKPFEHPFCGHDLAALERAKSRLHNALKRFDLSWREREMISEMLTARSIVELQQIRENWAEVCSVLPPTKI